MTSAHIKSPASLGLLTILLSSAFHAQANPVVSVTEGELAGISLDGVDQYRGIAYAKPPVGPLRWAAPQAVSPWSGRKDASQFGAACPQSPAPFADTAGNSEDCLSLNVYVPAGATTVRRPVLIWIHGSGTLLGSARQYDASYLAKTLQAVVVTVNYRLGALGWLWTSGMAAEAKGHNFALQDQQAAMRWVQRNIASFGGDPRRVTLSGESIGATSVSLHVASPAAAGLFHRAIMISGVEPPGVPKAAKAIEQGDAFGAKLNCPPGEQQMACLRGKDVAEILNVSPTYADIGREGIFWHPFVDGEIVTNDVFSAVSKGQFNRVPMMVGTTRDEGRGFTTLSFHADNTPMTQEEYVTATANWVNASVQPLLTQMIYPTSRYGLPALAFSQVVTDAFACLDTELARKALSHAPTYVYEFADRTAPEVIHDPFMASGAYHVSDIPYLFRTPFAQQPPIVLNAAQARLSAQMLRYWKSFVDTGNPNPSASVGDPVWPKYDAISTPVLTWVPDATHLQEWGAFQRAHQCSIWSILYSLRGLGAV